MCKDLDSALSSTHKAKEGVSDTPSPKTSLILFAKSLSCSYPRLSILRRFLQKVSVAHLISQLIRNLCHQLPKVFKDLNNKKTNNKSGEWWCSPGIPALWEAKVEGSQVLSSIWATS